MTPTPFHFHDEMLLLQPIKGSFAPSLPGPRQAPIIPTQDHLGLAMQDDRFIMRKVRPRASDCEESNGSGTMQDDGSRTARSERRLHRVTASLQDEKGTAKAAPLHLAIALLCKRAGT